METVHRGNNDGVIAICPKSGGENPWRKKESSVVLLDRLFHRRDGNEELLRDGNARRKARCCIHFHGSCPPPSFPLQICMFLHRNTKMVRSRVRKIKWLLPVDAFHRMRGRGRGREMFLEKRAATREHFMRVEQNNGVGYIGRVESISCPSKLCSLCGRVILSKEEWNNNKVE